MNRRAIRQSAWAVFAIACAAACSQTGGGASTAAGAAKHAPTASAGSRSRAPIAIGSVDANPSDPVVALPTGGTPPSDVRVPPPIGDLPGGWNLTAWSAQVQAAVGAHPRPTSRPVAASGWKVWYWSTPGVTDLSVGVYLGTSGAASQIDCAAQGFDPADQAAAADVSALLALCARADFPGSDPAEAAGWAAGQATPLLGELRTMTHGRTARTASPTFGTGVYTIDARYVADYGNTVQISIWGPAPK